MSDDQDQGNTASRGLRSVGTALGGWARRVGELVAEVSGPPATPDEFRQPLTQARAQRFAGDFSGAQRTLRTLIHAHPEQPHLHLALGLTLVHESIASEQPHGSWSEVIAAMQSDPLGPAPRHMLHGAQALGDNRTEPALDALRRAVQHLDSAPRDHTQELRLCIHLLTGLTQRRRGEYDRALRALHKARTQVPPELGAPVRHVLLRHGVELLLTNDEVSEAERWVDDALEYDGDDRLTRELHVSVLAAKGDEAGARDQLEWLGDDPALHGVRILVGLTVGLGPNSAIDLQTAADLHRAEAPHDPAYRRRWALAQLALHTQTSFHAPLNDDLQAEIVQALCDATAAAPRPVRERWLQELAHVALRLDRFSPTTYDPIVQWLRREEGRAPEELRLVRARQRIAEGDPSDEDFRPGLPPRFRSDPDLGGIAGPDPLSPLRDLDVRTAVLASQRALAAAERCRLEGHLELSQDLLVEALIEAPGLAKARHLLGEHTHRPGPARLEDRLSTTTTLLASIPNRILGVPLVGVQTALAQVIAARERLARPLTIAIMGEFSAGKSTFVNALLGQTVAPMGVLPTTCTINVFRRGPGQNARVHYRDGRIATLAPDDVEPFLHSLDPVEAARIRHVEIERREGRMGEASVVDTPGLNALDSFHEQVAREFLEQADAVVWLFSATRSGAATEAGMLSHLRAGGRQVLGILNKVDTLDDGEQAELVDYLRQQLGEVLVDVVPLCARNALEYRVANRSDGDDPFEPVVDALEHHFLQRAREIKRNLTARRLHEALVAGRNAIMETVEALEQQSETSLRTAQGERIGAHPLLLRFGDALEQRLLAVDDLLTREGLSLGMLGAGRGRLKGPIDPQDAEYLAATFREGTLAALRAALAPLAREDPAAAHVLDAQLVPWCQGHIDGLNLAGHLSQVLQRHGRKVAQSEATMRAGFRDALRTVARAWTTRAGQLAREVDRARARLDRQASSAPQAESLRLRSAVLSVIDHWIDAGQLAEEDRA